VDFSFFIMSKNAIAVNKMLVVTRSEKKVDVHLNLQQQEEHMYINI